MVFLLLMAVPLVTTSAYAKWRGVDETVVEKFAKDYGREARDPIINTDQGDLLLFVFLLGGATGGFIAGYCYRMLVVPSAKARADMGKQE